MNRQPHRRASVYSTLAALLTWLATLLLPLSASEAAPFTFLQPGFFQEIYGVTSHFQGGIAFAPDGDVWVNFCQFNGSPLSRLDLQSTTTVHSTVVHPDVSGSPFTSAAGCGLTNHPDGTLYSNIDNGTNGVANLNVNTGAVIRFLGPPGNALGITVDPQTNHLIYVGKDCRFTATCSILDLDPATGTTRAFATLPATDASFVDGIAFDPTGAFLFVSNRAPAHRLTVLNRAGAVVRHVAMSSEPDGIAFHSVAPKFVVTDNTDGTVTRFDFPNDDFTLPPTVQPCKGDRNDDFGAKSKYS
ncbi:MAG: hypothetical protein HY267_08115 [Deltaproteobacteria bacterium]|nr:hypothetical protein [Deltaproteobacteria bacterium]